MFQAIMMLLIGSLILGLFIHSIFAILKWLALPLIIWRIIMLFRLKDVNV